MKLLIVLLIFSAFALPSAFAETPDVDVSFLLNGLEEISSLEIENGNSVLWDCKINGTLPEGWTIYLGYVGRDYEAVTELPHLITYQKDFTNGNKIYYDSNNCFITNGETIKAVADPKFVAVHKNHPDTLLLTVEPMQPSLGDVLDISCTDFKNENLDEIDIYVNKVHLYGNEFEIPLDSLYDSLYIECIHNTLQSSSLERQTMNLFISNPNTVNSFSDNVVGDFGKKKKGGSTYNPPPTIGVDKEGKRLVNNGFSYNDNPVDAEYYHTEYPLITTNIGDKNTVEVIVFDDDGINSVKWIQLALGIPQIGSPLNDAEVIGQLILQNTEFDEFNITDKQNLIQKFTVSEIIPSKCMENSLSEKCLKITFEYEYRESPLYNIIAVSLMDSKRASWNFYFNDGVAVNGNSLNEPLTATFVEKLSNQGDVIIYELHRTDKWNDIWEDQFGSKYKHNAQYDTFKKITPDKTKIQNDPPSNVMTRIHSDFEKMISHEIKKATMIFDATKYQ